METPFEGTHSGLNVTQVKVIAKLPHRAQELTSERERERPPHFPRRARRLPENNEICDSWLAIRIAAAGRKPLPQPPFAHPVRYIMSKREEYPGDDNYSSVNHVADALETPATAGHDAEADPFSVPETPDQESGMVGVAKARGAGTSRGLASLQRASESGFRR